MQNPNNKRLIRINIILFIAVVIGIFFWGGISGNPPSNLQQAKPIPTKTSLPNHPEVSQDKVTSPPLPEVNPQPMSQEINSGNAPTIRVVDALGDLISNATLSIAGKIYNSTNGEFSIPKLESKTLPLEANAAGWVPKKTTIDLSTSTNVDIPLEYFCSFEILVIDYSNDKKPLEGVEVILWEGPEVKRPIPESVLLATKDVYSILGRKRNILVRRAPDELKVQQITDFRGGSRKLIPEWDNPNSGDILVALSSSCWRQNDRRCFPDPYTSNVPTSLRRIKLWDSLVLSGEYDSTNREALSLEFEHNGKRYLNAIYEAGDDIKGNIIARSLTDQTGVCRFKNLPPRIYFLQGRESKRRTRIEILTPHEKYKELKMWEASSQLIVNRRVGLTHPVPGWCDPPC